MIAFLLLIAGTVFLFLSTIFLFGLFGSHVEHPLGWLALGLTCWCAAVLFGAAAPVVQRVRE